MRRKKRYRLKPKIKPYVLSTDKDTNWWPRHSSESTEEWLDRIQPKPQWFAIVLPWEAVIGHSSDAENGKSGFVVEYRWFSDKKPNGQYKWLGTDELKEILAKEIDDIIRVEKRGYNSGCVFMHDYQYSETIKSQLKDDKMFYCAIQGKDIGFETKKTRDRMLKIAEAARKHKRCKVRYLKKNGKTVTRDIAAYSLDGGLLFVTDTKHGNKLIRSYRVYNIRAVKVLKRTFKPEWEVKL